MVDGVDDTRGVQNDCCWLPILIMTGKKRIGCQYFAGKFIFEVLIIPGNQG